MKANVLALLTAAPILAKDHSTEFQSGSLVSWETGAYGQNGNPGIITAVHCEQKTTPIYTVTVGAETYKLRLSVPDASGWTGDPLHDLTPGSAFQVRFDKQSAYVQYPNKRGKLVETVYTVGVESAAPISATK
jgi:hypothetical protein